MARGPFVTLEGVVQRIGDKVLWFRETGSAHDLCIPLSQVNNANEVGVGEIQIEVTKWIYTRLEEEGKL